MCTLQVLSLVYSSQIGEQIVKQYPPPPGVSDLRPLADQARARRGVARIVLGPGGVMLSVVVVTVVLMVCT